MTAVSVLIPLFNGVAWLPEAIDSVRAQTHPAWEIRIGVNGHAEGSEVHTAAKALADARTHVHCYPDIRSAPRTLRRLARAASYDTVCILDADDLWLPSKLARQLEAWRTGRDVVGTGCTYFGDADGAPVIPAGDVPEAAFFRANPMICSSVMLRREDVRFRDTFLYDYDLWLRLRAQGRRFFNVPEPLVRHRVHRASAFNSQGDAAGRKRALLLQHAGSRVALIRARLPPPFGRWPEHREPDE